MSYRWFLGGKVMFWIAIVLLACLISAFIVTYIVDVATIVAIKRFIKQDPTPIKEISENYVKSLRCRDGCTN